MRVDWDTECSPSDVGLIFLVGCPASVANGGHTSLCFMASCFDSLMACSSSLSRLTTLPPHLSGLCSNRSRGKEASEVRAL